MSILFLDFETKDHGIQQKLGAGWAYKDMCDVIGYSYAIDDERVAWSTNMVKLKALVDSCEVVACHNASYDVGILTMLGINTKEHLIYDTVIMAKLYDNSMHQYNLNALSKKYFNEEKLEEEFLDIAVELRLVKSKAQDPIKYCKENLDKVYDAYPEVVIRYANQDVELLRKLFRKYESDKEFFQEHDWTFYSDLIKCVLDIRKRGVRIDIARLFKSKAQLEKDLFTVNTKLSKYLQGRNPNSTKQLTEVCLELNVLVPLSEKGNSSITSKFIEEQEHEFFVLLSEYRKINKLYNDFVFGIIRTLRIIENIKESDSDDQLLEKRYSRIHPELNIFGATATGRFSGSNPNVQQLPKRNLYARPLIRSYFVPESDEQWYCLDFSAQEIRIQVHFAALIGSKSGIELAEKWNLNESWDVHTAIAEMCNIDRTSAKAINLGLSYGLGIGKLCRSLKVDNKTGKALIAQYHAKAPYLEELVGACKANMNKRLYIRTILNRKLRKDADFIDDDGRVQDFLYKSINKLIQGSAADQSNSAMVAAYRAGLHLKFPVHDELTISTASELDVAKLQYIMRNAVRLKVQAVAEITSGTSFYDQQEHHVHLTAEEQKEFDRFVVEFKPIKEA